MHKSRYFGDALLLLVVWSENLLSTFLTVLSGGLDGIGLSSAALSAALCTAPIMDARAPFSSIT